MYLQHGQAGTIPLYVGIIYVLLHRLVWGVGNKISCLWWQLGEQQGWSLPVLHRHAFNGDYRVTDAWDLDRTSSEMSTLLLYRYSGHTLIPDLISDK